jgi:hypothetical protein
MAEEAKKPKELKFVYEKARHHRVLHADGAWSGITPHAEIQVSFYTNLRPLPLSVTHAVQDDNLGPGVQQEKSELVREVDVTVIMNIVAAKAVVELLNQMIAQAEPIVASKTIRLTSDETKNVDNNG